MAEGEIEVDARGLLCPLPVLRLAKALRGLPAGSRAHLIATDPAAIEDVATFCRERSCRLLESDERKGVYSFVIVKEE